MIDVAITPAKKERKNKKNPFHDGWCARMAASTSFLSEDFPEARHLRLCGRPYEWLACPFEACKRSSFCRGHGLRLGWCTFQRVHDAPTRLTPDVKASFIASGSYIRTRPEDSYCPITWCFRLMSQRLESPEAD